MPQIDAKEERRVLRYASDGLSAEARWPGKPWRVFQVPEVRSDKPDDACLGTLGGLEPEDQVPGKAAG